MRGIYDRGSILAWRNLHMARPRAEMQARLYVATNSYISLPRLAEFENPQFSPAERLDL